MSKENCRNAYRKHGLKAVFCKAIKGDMDYCIAQEMCHLTGRYEATKNSGLCKLRSAPPVK